MRRKNSTACWDPEGEPRGALRLGVPQSLSEIALPAALSALSQQFPGLSPQITCGWSGQLQRWLENGELDGMLAMGPAQQSFAEGYSGRLLCPLEVVPIVGRRLNLRASSLRECAERGWILNPDGCGLRAGLIRELQSQGLRLTLNVESAGAQLQIALVAQGAGAGSGAEGGAGQQPVAGRGRGPQPQRFSACGLTVADPRPVSGEPAAAADLFCQQSDAAADRIRLKALCIFV